MKKIKIIFAFLLITVLTGCGNDLSKVDSYIKYTKVDDFVCPELDSNKFDIYIGDGEYFVMKDDKMYYLYEYNYPLLYDNDENCKVIKVSNKKIIGLKSSNIIYDDFSVEKINYNGQIESAGRRDYDKKNLDIKYIVSGVNLYGQLYSGLFVNPIFVTNSAIYVDNATLGPQKLFEVGYDEKITKIFHKTIITADNVYIYGLKNPDCKKYMTNDCSYDFVKNEELNDIKKNIALITANYIILKDGTTFKYEE